MTLRPASRSLLALILSMGALIAADPGLTLKSPVAQAVLQRQSANTGRVLVGGEVQSDTPVSVEIRLDGGEWKPVPTMENPGTIVVQSFSQTLDLPKGMHTLEARAVRDKQPLASTSKVQFGIGEVFVVTGQSNSANHGAVKTKATSDQVFTLTPKGTWQLLCSIGCDSK